MSNAILAVKICLEKAQACNSAQSSEATVYATEAVAMAIVAQIEAMNRIGDCLDTLIYHLSATLPARTGQHD
jgi:hypothetical protein